MPDEAAHQFRLHYEFGYGDYLHFPDDAQSEMEGVVVEVVQADDDHSGLDGHDDAEQDDTVLQHYSVSNADSLHSEIYWDLEVVLASPLSSY